jgi:hypothetical protein
MGSELRGQFFQAKKQQKGPELHHDMQDFVAIT